MPDTQTVTEHLTADAFPRYKLTEAAVERLRTRLAVPDIETLGDRLGFSRQTFWRLRKGEYDIKLAEARHLAALAAWPLDRTFELVSRG